MTDITQTPGYIAARERADQKAIVQYLALVRYARLKAKAEEYERNLLKGGRHE